MRSFATPQGRLAVALALVVAVAAGHARGADVTTYHMDTLRTGWNQAETVLTPATVGSVSFGLLTQVALDEQVDAQPLVVDGVSLGGASHNVVYVATENDSLYAIDAASGAILAEANYGTPVPASVLPGQCNNNSDVVGINSTPVIDPKTRTLYAVTYTYENATPVFRLHAIDLATLADKLPPVVISGSARLANGQAEMFNPAVQRQRSGLLLSNGRIYIGFASFCDIDSNQSRGWMLSYDALTLAAKAPAVLTNRRVTAPDYFFLSSIWMSGFGPAADASGNVYFTTGNSDYSGTTYNQQTNLSESLVKLPPTLDKVEGFFTPHGGSAGWSALDKEDGDFGGGGVLLLPDQAGAVPHLAVAIGKFGPMYLFNRDALPGLAPPAAALGTYTNSGCWCGPSFYTGSDGIGRVVESTGNVLDTWTIETNPKPGLTLESLTNIATGQDPGFLTSVSSNGTEAGSAVVWAVSRPSTDTSLQLYAFDPAQGLKQLYQGTAGSWPFAATANSYTVPIASDGRVFVASYKTLAIFGLATGAQTHIAFRPAAAPPMRDADWLRGLVTAIAPHALQLQLANGKTTWVGLAPNATTPALPTLLHLPVEADASPQANGYTARHILKLVQAATLSQNK